MSSNSTDEVFTQRMTDLQTSMQKNGASMETSVTTKWLALYSDKDSGDDGKVLNGLDPAEFVKAFDRTKLNKAYLDTLKPDAGGWFTSETKFSYRDAQVAKVQIDLMAGMERDLRMRYRSRVRMLAHGVARMQSHGLSVGPINRGIVNFVKLLADRQT